MHVAALTDARSGRLRTPRKYLGLLMRTLVAVRRFRPDLIHAHFVVPTGSIARAAAAMTGTRLVVTAHGTDIRNALAFPRVRRRTVDVLEQSRCVVAVSQQLADAIASIAPDSAPRVIDMGIDTQVFAPPPQPAVLRAADEPFRMVCVASLLPNKNHANLIRAVARIPQTRLVCVGEGPTRPALEALIAELGVGDRVALTGRLPQEDVAEFYRTMDAACLVSLEEGFGLSALEAAACGCPVIVSASAPVAAIIAQHDAGVMVDDPSSADAIAQAIIELGQYPRLADDVSRAIVAGRSTDDRAQEVTRLYADCAQVRREP